MLLKVLKKGRQLYRYLCDICGQEELHDCEGDVLAPLWMCATTITVLVLVTILTEV